MQALLVGGQTVALLAMVVGEARGAIRQLADHKEKERPYASPPLDYPTQGGLRQGP